MDRCLKIVCTVAVGCVVAAINGCHVDQNREVAQYRHVLDQHLPPTTLPTSEESLNLERVLSLASTSSEQLGLSGEDYVQSLINKNRIVAAFLPTVSFQPAYTIGQRPSGSSTPGGTVSGINTSFRAHGDTIERLDAPVVGEINVFRGFGDITNLRAAESVIAQRKELLLDLQATILLNVAQTYYQVLRSEQFVIVLRQSVELEQARLADIETQFRNGLATNLAVAQTRAQLDATRVTLLQALSDVRNSRNTLALLAGLQSVANPLLNNSVVPSDLGGENQYEEQALQNRHDIQASKAAVAAARHSVDAAISQYYPSVSLNLNGFLYREFYADASKWNAVLSANLPIFSAGLIEANVRLAWSRLRQAALQESATRRDAIHDVQVAYENLQTAQQRIIGLLDEVQAAQAAYTQSLDAVRNGLATNLDAVTAQAQLLDAQLQLSSATFDRTIFYLDLLRATGVFPDVLFAASHLNQSN